MKTSFGEPNPFAQPDSRGGGAALILQVTDLEEARQVVDLCVIDLDATLITAHSEKQGAVPGYWALVVRLR